jgi:outer membrane receptor protein involved in Fe transport
MFSVDVAEDLVRAYANWLPRERISVSAEYLHERIDNSGTFFAQGYSELRTDRLPIHFTFHSGAGLSASLTATYVEQRGTFEDTSVPPPFPPIDAEDSFWVADAAVRYRLKNRLGTVSLSVNNLFDEEFRFQDSDPENPQILPERVILLRFTLAR